MSSIWIFDLNPFHKVFRISLFVKKCLKTLQCPIKNCGTTLLESIWVSEQGYHFNCYFFEDSWRTSQRAIWFRLNISVDKAGFFLTHTQSVFFFYVWFRTLCFWSWWFLNDKAREFLTQRFPVFGMAESKHDGVENASYFGCTRRYLCPKGSEQFSVTKGSYNDTCSIWCPNCYPKEYIWHCNLANLQLCTLLRLKPYTNVLCNSVLK